MCVCVSARACMCALRGLPCASDRPDTFLCMCGRRLTLRARLQFAVTPKALAPTAAIVFGHSLGFTLAYILMLAAMTYVALWGAR